VDDPGVVVLVHQVPLPGMAAIDEVLNRRLQEQHSVSKLLIFIYIYSKNRVDYQGPRMSSNLIL